MLDLSQHFSTLAPLKLPGSFSKRPRAVESEFGVGGSASFGTVSHPMEHLGVKVTDWGGGRLQSLFV